MVEVAYELLYGEGDDKDAAEEEFADQCRVFASSSTPLDTSDAQNNGKKDHLVHRTFKRVRKPHKL